MTESRTLKTNKKRENKRGERRNNKSTVNYRLMTQSRAARPTSLLERRRLITEERMKCLPL